MASYVGVQCSFSDGRDGVPVEATTLPNGEEHAWLNQPYDDEWCLRLLTTASQHSQPFGQEVVKIACPPDGTDYVRLSASTGGGCSAIIGYPIKFIAQTPYDGGPFASFALTTTSWRKGLVSGIYTASDPMFDCAKVLTPARLHSGWRSDCWQIMVLPASFLVAHATYSEQAIARLTRRVAELEDEVTAPRRIDDDNMDFTALTRRLHECSAEAMRLERRAHFEKALARGIDAVLVEAESGRKGASCLELIKGPLNLARSMMLAQEYDLQAVPKRLDSQRTLIFNLVLQRDSRLALQMARTNIEIAETSRRIAEASMRDSASMKTIAILTMVSLPGTAVASFFSMTMFNWQPTSGIASSYVWIYFVTSVPLTAVVLLVWYFTLQRRHRAQRAKTFPIVLPHATLGSTSEFPKGVEDA